MNNLKWYKFLTEKKEATEPLLREITPRIEEYSKIVMDSIVDNEYYHLLFAGGPRYGLILDTQKGRLPFYRSSGTSVEGKEEGEWTIFKGYQINSENFGHLRKSTRSFELTQGKDRYLSILALVLEYLWSNKNLESKLQRVDFYEIARKRKDQINNKIKELNQQEDKYMFYNTDELQGAYLNSYLQDKDALSSVVFDSLNLGDEYTGLKEIRSEQLTQFNIIGRFLPKLEDVVG